MSKKIKALEKAITLIGNQTKLANAIGVKQQSVNKWLRSGVPPRRVLAIEEATSGRVTRYELSPDLYPAP